MQKRSGPPPEGRVPLTITLSEEDYEWAQKVLASNNPKARDDFFMAAIDALRLHVAATLDYLEENGFEPDSAIPPLKYNVVVRPEAH